MNIASLFPHLSLNNSQSLSLQSAGGTQPPNWLSLQLNLESVASLPLVAGSKGVVSQGIVYCADQGQGLVISDFTNLSAPVQIGNYSTPVALDICFGQNNTVFVADAVDGILAFNVSHPNSPTLLGSYSTPSITGITWNQGILATASSAYGVVGLQFYNALNPGNITLIGQVPSLSEISGIGFYNSSVFYALSINQGLVVVNTTNLRAPVVQKIIPTNGRPRWFAIHKQLLFLGTGDTNTLVQVYNLQNPLSPSPLGSLQVTKPNGWFVNDDYAFFADSESGLRIVDYSSPQNLNLAGSLPLGSISQGVAVENNVAYVISSNRIDAVPINKLAASLQGIPQSSAEGNENLVLSVKEGGNIVSSYPFSLTVDQTPLIIAPFPTLSTTPNPSQTFQWNFVPSNYFSCANPLLIRFNAPSFLNYQVQLVELGSLTNIGQIVRLKMNGNIVYGVDYWSNLVICDFTNVNAPVLVNKMPLYIWDLFFDGTNLYASLGTNGLSIYSPSNPSNPVLLSNIPNSQYVVTAFVKNSILCVGVVHAGYSLTPTTGLMLYSVTNPSAPAYLGGYFNIAVGTIYVDDQQIAYVTGNNQLTILDLSSPTNIKLLSQIPINGINTVVFEGSPLIKAGNFIMFAEASGIRIMNAAVPTNLVDVNFIPLTVVNNLILNNNILYVAVGGLGVQLYDATYLPELRLIGTYSTGGSAADLFIQGETLVAGISSEGIAALNINTSDLVWRLYGKAPTAGNFNIDVSAQTPFGTVTTGSLTLRVEGPPVPAHSLADDIALTHLLYQKYIPSNTFMDPNNDPIELTATMADGSPLVPFLTFNSNSATFSGTPQTSDAGNYSIAVLATAPTGEAVTFFELYVDNAPLVQNLLPQISCKVGASLNYKIPAGTFIDLDGHSLTYSISNLPSSLSFTPQGVLTGVPTSFDLGVTTLTVTASDGRGGEATTDLKLLVQNEVAPQVSGYIASQQAVVGQAFFFPIPNVFYSPTGDPLTISVEQPPAWLNWNPKTQSVSGVPGQNDIGTFTPMTFKVQVIATDGILNTSTSFDITVSGTSTTDSLLKAAGTIFGLFLAMVGWYKKRGVFLNPFMIKRRTYIRKKIEVGNTTLVVPISTPKEETKAVKSYIGRPDSADKPKWWEAFIWDTPIAGGHSLPHWLIHDSSENKLRINPASNGPQVEEVVKVVISNYGDFRKEEITIMVGTFGKRKSAQNIELASF